MNPDKLEMASSITIKIFVAQPCWHRIQVNLMKRLLKTSYRFRLGRAVCEVVVPSAVPHGYWVEVRQDTTDGIVTDPDRDHLSSGGWPKFKHRNGSIYCQKSSA
jgi:hypothetical protein